MIDEPKKGESLPSEDLELEAYKSSLGVEDLTLLKSSAVVEREGPTDDTFLRRVEAHVKFGREILGKV